MKIAFTAKGDSWDSMIDERFGRTQYILLYDDEKKELICHDNSSINDVAHGAGPQTAKQVLDMSPDIVITGNGPGGNAGSVLSQRKISIYSGAGNMTIKQAYDAYINNSLQLLD